MKINASHWMAALAACWTLASCSPITTPAKNYDDLIKILDVKYVDEPGVWNGEFGANPWYMRTWSGYNGENKVLTINDRARLLMCRNKEWNGHQERSDPFHGLYSDWPSVSSQLALANQDPSYLDIAMGTKHSDFHRFYGGRSIKDRSWSTTMYSETTARQSLYRLNNAYGMPFYAVSMSRLKCNDMIGALYNTRGRVIGFFLYRTKRGYIAMDLAVGHSIDNVINIESDN